MRTLFVGVIAATLAAGMASAQTSGKATGSGDDNQAVATSSANASTPAAGRNSFTKGEARRRIQAEGYTHVVSLRKDDHGVWRGSATKDGWPVMVWLDYKGNVGTAQQ